MKRRTKIAVIGLFALMALLSVGVTATVGWRPIIGPKARPLTNRTFESTPARLERGKYLAESVMGCFYCHSERDWKTPGAPPIESRKGAGAPFPDGPGKIYAPNITPDPETGIGSWSDDAIARAIREGVTADGHALFPIMPYPNYASLPDEDLAALVVYLKSIPPVKNQVPRSEIIFPVNRIMNNFPQPIEGAVAEPDMSTIEKRGAFLARQASCADCHSPSDRGAPIAGLEYAGGMSLTEGSGTVTATNLTPDATGIGGYDESAFINVIRTGRAGGRELNPAMPWSLYGKMGDEDLKAIYAFLKSLPAVRHRIDNTMPPTPCRICKQRHGMGDQN